MVILLRSLIVVINVITQTEFYISRVHNLVVLMKLIVALVLVVVTMYDDITIIVIVFIKDGEWVFFLR